MFGIMMVLFFVVFGIIMASTVFGFWSTARLSGKIFQVVERELDRKISGASETKLSCAHCGSMITATDKCPNCGAGIAS